MFAKGEPQDYANLHDFIYDTFGKSIKMSTLYKIIQRNDQVKSIRGIPMETIRAEVSLEVIIEYYDRLSVVLQYNILHLFFFNLDESGFQDYLDSGCNGLKSLQC